MRTAIVILLLALSIGSCTKQDRAKNFGGTVTQKLAPNRKLVTVTWKDADLWTLTRPMTGTDQAEKYEFKESSSFGVMQGTVIIEEVKE